ncbi:hypothetical protein PHET_05042 [Paragonimus heterotremus]|uniref:Uncharacterized protein n=1 Tax=Paragonimus heterotremus TaxID=100268 RepID=A0A8J4TFG2_9TREM|nr:hypothetical protein PHET_05042 [Paragonimus heterotremus]
MLVLFTIDLCDSYIVTVLRVSSDALGSVWSHVYPHFKERVQRKTNQSSPLTERAARELATVALEFVNLSYINCTVQTIISVAKPLDLLEFFAFDPTVDYAVRFAVLEICFTSPGTLDHLIASSITSSVDDTVTIGWRFLTCWLAYCLLVRPCMEEREQNHLNSYERLTVIGSQFSAHFPSEVANLVTESDVELTLINIAARFDELTAFHERMAYKMLASTHLSRLCLLLCDCCSVSSLARDIHTGREFCRLPDLSVDSLNFVGFRAVSLLIRHCAQLLHAPVTGPGALSAMEQLIDNFVLPRQLYDWERLCRHTSSVSVEQPLAKSVMECLCDKLTEFTSGLAQLAWRSDAYIARILRDIIRLYYAHLGSECIAVAIVNSPTVDYRVHLLQLSMHEAMNEMNSRNSEQGESPRQQRQQPVQQRRRAVAKWIQLCHVVLDGSRSIEARQRDAPYIVGPLLYSRADADNETWMSVEMEQDCRSIFGKCKQAITAVASSEMRKNVHETCKGLNRVYELLPDLCTYFGIKQS